MSAQNMTALTTMPTPPNRRTDTPAVFSEKVQATVDAEKKMVDEFNTRIIPAHNSIVDPVNQVLANIADIKTVSGINSAVSIVAGIKANVLSIDSVKPQVVRVSQSAEKIDRVHTSIAKVDTVNDHIANVDTVSTNIGNVNTTATNIANVNTTAINIANVNTAASKIANINTVSESIVSINTVANISSAVADISSDHAMFTRLDLASPILTRIDANSANINTVSDISTAVSSIVEDKAIIDTVFGKLPIIQSVEENLSHIVAVDAAETAIKTLGLHINNIDAVGGNIDDVSAVHDALNDIADVKADLQHVKTVAGHVANVDAVGRNIAAVQEVDRRMQLIINAPTNASVASAAATESTKQSALAKQYAESASAVAGLPVATDANDKQVVFWNKDKGEYDLGATVGENLLPAPAITLAAQLPVGFDTPIILTGLAGIVGTTIVSFQLQVNDAEIQYLNATNNTYSGVVKAQGLDSAIWTVKARAIDSKGNVSLWNQTTAVLVVPSVNKPNVISPLSGAIVNNKIVSITSSLFGSVHLADTHKASRWTITSDEAGNNILHDSGWRQDALTTYTATVDPVADADTDIFAHVQHEGVLIGQSVKSTAVQLKTSYVLRPAIASPLLSTMVGTDRIEMTCSAFATYAGNFDTHVATRWKVTTDAEGNNALCDSGWNSAYLTEYTAVLSPIADPASNLYLWVEQRGELLGDSAKSAGVRVVTGSLQTPVITVPAANAITLPTGFTVTGAAFAPAVGAIDTMKALYVQCATDELFTNKIYDSGRILTTSTTHIVTFASQAHGSAVFTRLRYEGTTLGISGYSEPVKTVVTAVTAPTITSPVNDAVGIPTKPQIVMTGYSDTGNLDAGINTQVQISSASDFTMIVYDSGELAYGTSHTVVTALSPSVQYFIRVRHKGSKLGWTAWSNVVSMITGATVVPWFTIGDSEFENTSYCLPYRTWTVVNGAFRPTNVDILNWQVAKDVSFTNIIQDTDYKIGDYTTLIFTIDFPTQEPGGSVFVRMRFHSPAFGYSAWSGATKLTVTTVVAPTITSPVNGATDISIRPAFAFSAGIDTGSLDTGSKTQIQISINNAFSNIAYDSGEIAYTTTHIVPALAYITKYYARFRHKGIELGWTPWSSIVGMTTKVNPAGNQIFDAPGNYTFTVPASVETLVVGVIGGGANGGSKNGGGGGAFVSGRVTVSPGQQFSVVVGGVSGTSSFGSLITCTGGNGQNGGIASNTAAVQVIKKMNGGSGGAAGGGGGLGGNGNAGGGGINGDGFHTGSGNSDYGGGINGWKGAIQPQSGLFIDYLKELALYSFRENPSAALGSYGASGRMQYPESVHVSGFGAGGCSLSAMNSVGGSGGYGGGGGGRAASRGGKAGVGGGGGKEGGGSTGSGEYPGAGGIGNVLIFWGI